MLFLKILFMTESNVEFHCVFSFFAQPFLFPGVNSCFDFKNLLKKLSLIPNKTINCLNLFYKISDTLGILSTLHS